mmetsp:Transcript_23129/g.23338  ORF Transcript_23129/g.23338 Transcript_23129/m.23338 type:complete len:83 (-) Transcript_23129:698-946(-)|eukprot:CAMPEP_0182433528 /NCGR_PEP_ID=MMETSP1167-20130531/63811_1 /TAXON_ID=2988 /ORGANISM="Mallomonas Sp, Strain CCMP3275" /LENGTH=82 /DNA_ID=CAMNT_0024622333 /DNA_START=268 /DNA_END=516 /DNA_ORIENTATION=+
MTGYIPVGEGSGSDVTERVPDSPELVPPQMQVVELLGVQVVDGRPLDDQETGLHILGRVSVGESREGSRGAAPGVVEGPIRP